MPPLRPFPSTTKSTLRSLSILSTLFGSTSTTSTSTSPTMSTPPASSYTTHPYTPTHPHGPFPYTPTDLTPHDTTPDASFYSTPRFVTHIDDNAIANLRQYYDTFLPKKGRILDFCSSWVSHYPASVERAVDAGELVVLGLGMNEGEMGANGLMNVRSGRGDGDGEGEVEKGEKVARRWAIRDLNVEPEVVLPDNKGELDASTCVVSVDYLTRPVEVLRSLRGATNEGGSVHLVVSNRCFPTKAVGRWLRVSEEKRLEMVGDYLWWSGWREIEVVVIVEQGSWMKDPLWVVRGRNVGEGGEVGGGKSEL